MVLLMLACSGEPQPVDSSPVVDTAPLDTGDTAVDTAVEPDCPETSETPTVTTAEELQQALLQGGRIVLAAGVYEGHFVIEQPVELIGACRETTWLVGTDPEEDVVDVGGEADGFLIEEIGVTGIGLRGLDLRREGTVRRVLVQDMEATGIRTYDPVVLEQVVVRDMRGDGSTLHGVCLYIRDDAPTLTDLHLSQCQTGGLYVGEEGGSTTATQLVVEDSQWFGVLAFGGSLDLHDSRISGIRGLNPNQLGYALWAYGKSVDTYGVTLTDNDVVAVAQDGNRLNLVDTWVQGNTYGIQCIGGGTVTLQDADVVDTTHDAVVSDGCGLGMTRVRIDGTGGYGVQAKDARWTSESGLEIRNAAQAGIVDGYSGEPARVTLYDPLLEDNGAPLQAQGPDADVTLERPQFSGNPGIALAAIDGATLQVTEGVFVDNQGPHLVAQSGANVRLQDTTFARGLPNPDGTGGRAIAVRGADTLLAATDVDVQDHNEAGVVVSQDAWAVLRRVTVRDVDPGPQFSIGAGIAVETGGVLVASDLSVEDIRGPGVFALSQGDVRCVDCVVKNAQFAGLLIDRAIASWENSHIARIGPSPNQGAGFGLYARGGRLHLLNSTITDTQGAAVYLREHGDWTLEGSVLHGGAQLLRNDVLQHGNAVFAMDGTVHLVSTWLTQATDGLFLHQADATLDDVTFSDNSHDILQQDCTEPLQTDVDGTFCQTPWAPFWDLTFDLRYDDIDVQ